MSQKTGKKLKVLSTVVFSVLTALFLVFAVLFFKTNLIYSFIFVALSLVSAIMLIPFVKMANTVTSDTVEMEATGEDQLSLTDMYAPAYIETTVIESANIEKEGEEDDENMETKQMKVSIKRSSPMSEDFTREVGIEKNVRAIADDILGEDEDEGNGEFQSTTMIETPSFNEIPGKGTESKATVAAGGLHTVAVRESGNVLVTGYNNYGQCNVEEWENVIAVAAGSYHTAALFADGTCGAVGYNGNRQCDVQGWSDVCDIATGVAHTVGLCTDGTCVATGDNTYGQCNIEGWSDIVAICAGYNCTAGLRSDGTVIAVGLDIDSSASKWRNIVSITAGRLHLVGLKKNGCCVAMGNNSNGQCDVGRWSGIKAIAAGNYHTVGLSKDGTCIATGYNGYGQCNVHKWTNIRAIAAGRNHTVALNKYGRVLAVGDNSSAQCETKDFDEILVAD